MKKFVVSSAFAFVVACLISCEHEKLQKDIVKDNVSPLVTDLASFNQNLLGSIDGHGNVTRGFWDSLLRACAVVGSDAIGAYEGGKVGGLIGSLGGPGGAAVGSVVGGLICGAGASYMAFRSTEFGLVDNNDGSYKLDRVYTEPCILYHAVNDIREAEKNQYKEEAGVAINLPSDYMVAEEIAIEHNIALKRVFEDSVVTTEVSDDAVLRLFDTPEFKSKYQHLMDNMVLSLDELGKIDIGAYLKNADASMYSPVTANILKLFFDIYTCYPSKMEDIDFIVNYYINKIEVSEEVPSEDRKSLYTALAVAAYSPRMWEPIIETEMQKRNANIEYGLIGE